jgi:hypothetical protein
MSDPDRSSLRVLPTRLGIWALVTSLLGLGLTFSAWIATIQDTCEVYCGGLVGAGFLIIAFPIALVVGLVLSIIAIVRSPRNRPAGVVGTALVLIAVSFLITEFVVNC